MADPDRALPTNVGADLYVDATCIDCATCRRMAPETFDRSGEQSRVRAQPQDEAAWLRALKALVSCPTASIGTRARHDVAAAIAGLPELVEDPVYFCGFTSEKSFGAASYLIVRDEGNVLVDAPRFAAPLARAIERLGGVAHLFLTHKDDVADHAKWRERFRCERILHARDVTHDTRGVERVFGGDEPLRLAPDLVAIPTPGHTAGSACLAFRDAFLFTGDHLAKNPSDGSLYAFRSACWFDWDVQIRSMQALLDVPFRRVLPGHGHPYEASTPAQARAALERCIAWMRNPRGEEW